MQQEFASTMGEHMEKIVAQHNNKQFQRVFTVVDMMLSRESSVKEEHIDNLCSHLPHSVFSDFLGKLLKAGCVDMKDVPVNNSAALEALCALTSLKTTEGVASFFGAERLENVGNVPH